MRLIDADALTCLLQKYLEDRANQICTKKIETATAYKDGYIQACEDFAREMRHAISENQG
ncbi:MAG: hypothetical protein LUE11_04860 [Clostridia bacterium]|nr:hypothetical protein [Clostridia bacterium]